MSRPLEDVRLVNCAGPCGAELLPPSEVDFAASLNPKARRHLPAKLVAGRVDGRPYCQQCRALVSAPAEGAVRAGEE